MHTSTLIILTIFAYLVLLAWFDYKHTHWGSYKQGFQEGIKYEREMCAMICESIGHSELLNKAVGECGLAAQRIRARGEEE